MTGLESCFSFWWILRIAALLDGHGEVGSGKEHWLHDEYTMLTGCYGFWERLVQ